MYDDCRQMPSVAKKLFFDKLSVSPNNLTADNLKRLHTFAKQHLPAAVAAIICQTKAPFLQHIVDLQTPTHQHERIFFTGDAATVLRPHLAAGAKTALDSAIKLAKICAENKPKDLDALLATLSRWSKEQLAIASDQVIFAKRMGAALVTHAPDWNKMDAKITQEWWDTHVMKAQPWHMTSNNYQTPRAKL